MRFICKYYGQSLTGKWVEQQRRRDLKDRVFCEDNRENKVETLMLKEGLLDGKLGTIFPPNDAGAQKSPDYERAHVSLKRGEIG